MRVSIPLVFGALLLLAPVTGWGAEASKEAASPAEGGETYDQESVLDAAVEFFGTASEGIAKAIEKAFSDLGEPNGYIRGEESSGAIVFGLRYGSGVLQMKDGESRKLFWNGPSIGFDLGGNVAKTFILVYNLEDLDDLYQRYPALDGSLYYVGGVGVNYHQSSDVVLAPIRVGVGLRAGASVGYMHYTPERSWVPF